MTNNIGNLRPVGSSTGFMQYDTPQAGIQAMRDDLLAKINGHSNAMKANYGEGYSPTLANVISTYAPGNENDIANYIKNVSQWSGIAPDEVLTPDHISKLQPAMIRQENGQKGLDAYKQYADSGQISSDALPEGFVLDSAPSGGKSDLPEGFVLDKPSENNESGSFIGEMKANVANAVQSGKDLLSGNFDVLHSTLPTPKTDALAEKLFPNGSDGSFLGAVRNLGNTSPSDFSGALLEHFNNTPAGKALSVIGGLNPVYNAAGTAINRYANPAIEKATGISPDSLALLELAAPVAGIKKAGEISDPTVSVLKSFAGKAANPIVDTVAKQSALKSGEIVKPDMTPALSKVYDRMRADFPGDASFNKALNSYASKNDESLLQAGGSRLANLAEGAAQYPSGAGEAVNFFKNKVANAPDQIKAAMAKAISPSTNFYDILDNMVEAGRKTAAPIYRDAFKANPSIQSPLINKILATPEGSSALSEAVKNVQNEMAAVAKPDKELTALAKELSDIGLMDPQKGGVARGLTLRALDQVKKSMDGTIKQAYRAGDDAQAARITNLKNSLVSEIDNQDKSGLYAKARDVSGDYLSNKSAMQAGLDFFKDDPEIVAQNYKGYSTANKQAYKIGVIKALRNNIDDKYDGRNVAQLFDKPSNRSRLQAILPKNAYDKLLSDADATDAIFKLRNQIVGNSRTALRQIAASEFDAPTQEFVQQVAQKGWKNVAIDKSIQFIKRRFDGFSDKLAADTAKILYETDPKAKYKIVKELTNRARLEPSSIRGTQAAKELQAFYIISSDISKARQVPPSAIVGGALSQQNQPLMTRTGR